MYLYFPDTPRIYIYIYTPGCCKSLARPGRKQAQVFFFLQGKAPKEIQTILRETLACFLRGRAKDLSAPLYMCVCVYMHSEERNTYRILMEKPEGRCLHCGFRLGWWIILKLLLDKQKIRMWS